MGNNGQGGKRYVFKAGDKGQRFKVLTKYLLFKLLMLGKELDRFHSINYLDGNS